MSAATDREKAGCADVRELAAWYPTTSLSEDERRRVEEHVATCSTCAAVVQLATEMRDHLHATVGPHPDPVDLVRFVEDPCSLAGLKREQIEAHLAACADCAHEVAILQEMERAEAVAPQTSPARRVSLGEWLRVLWDGLAGSLLRPVPAAVYLAVAVVACVFLVGRVDRGAGAPPSSIGLGSVVLLSGDAASLRGPSDEARTLPVLPRSTDQVLLLEFVDLATPPEPQDLYRVQVMVAESGLLVWQGSVRGEEFLENYTLALSLDTEHLEPARYQVTVCDPAGEAILEAAFRVQD